MAPVFWYLLPCLLSTVETSLDASVERQDMLQSRAVLTVATTAITTLGIGTAAYGVIEIIQTNSSAGATHLPSLVPLEAVQSSEIIEKPKVGSFIGSLSIKRLHLVIPIVEGSDTSKVENSVGHYIGSVLPGVSNNSVLAGHRDSSFKNLGKLRVGDLLTVKTKWGRFVYEVERFRIVMADNATVIVPTRDAELTLSTCFPFDYIGEAPMRFVVQTKLISDNAIS